MNWRGAADSVNVGEGESKFYFFFSLMKRHTSVDDEEEKAYIYFLLCLDTKKQKSSDYIIC